MSILISADLVDTGIGPLPRHELTFRDITTENDNAIQTTRIWTHKGVEVRRDAWTDIKRGLSTQIAHG